MPTRLRPPPTSSCTTRPTPTGASSCVGSPCTRRRPDSRTGRRRQPVPAPRSVRPVDALRLVPEARRRLPPPAPRYGRRHRALPGRGRRRTAGARCRASRCPWRRSSTGCRRRRPDMPRSLRSPREVSAGRGAPNSARPEHCDARRGRGGLRVFSAATATARRAGQVRVRPRTVPGIWAEHQTVRAAGRVDVPHVARVDLGSVL